MYSFRPCHHHHRLKRISLHPKIKSKIIYLIHSDQWNSAIYVFHNAEESLTCDVFCWLLISSDSGKQCDCDFNCLHLSARHKPQRNKQNPPSSTFVYSFQKVVIHISCKGSDRKSTNIISGKIQDYCGASQHHYRGFPGALREIKMSVAANVGPGGALVYTHSASSYLLTLRLLAGPQSGQ